MEHRSLKETSVEREIYFVWSTLKSTYSNPYTYRDYLSRVALVYSTHRGICVFVRDKRNDEIVWLDVVGIGIFVSLARTKQLAQVLKENGCKKVYSRALTPRIAQYLEFLGFNWNGEVYEYATGIDPVTDCA